jgi:hypothetical protein
MIQAMDVAPIEACSLIGTPIVMDFLKAFLCAELYTQTFVEKASRTAWMFRVLWSLLCGPFLVMV